jgi:hypothetical protein
VKITRYRYITSVLSPEAKYLRCIINFNFLVIVEMQPVNDEGVAMCLMSVPRKDDLKDSLFSVLTSSRRNVKCP